MSYELNEDHVIMRNNFDSFLNTILVFSISFVLDIFILVYVLISFKIDLINKYGNIVNFILTNHLILVVFLITCNYVLNHIKRVSQLLLPIK